MIDRRTFLVGTGLFLTAATLARYMRAIETGGPPIIDAPKKAKYELVVYPGRDYEINLAPWDKTLVVPTWREWWMNDNRRIEGEPPPDLQEFLDGWGIEPLELDNKMDSGAFLESWARSESPNAKAFRLLDKLNIGSKLKGVDGEVGELTYMDGPAPGNDYLGVFCDDDLTISLLQAQLREMGESIRVVIGDEANRPLPSFDSSQSTNQESGWLLTRNDFAGMKICGNFFASMPEKLRARIEPVFRNELAKTYGWK